MWAVVPSCSEIHSIHPRHGEGSEEEGREYEVECRKPSPLTACLHISHPIDKMHVPTDWQQVAHIPACSTQLDHFYCKEQLHKASQPFSLNPVSD